MNVVYSHGKLVTWIQKRCAKCKRFMERKRIKYCKKCAKEEYKTNFNNYYNNLYHNDPIFRAKRLLKERIRYDL